MPNPKRSVKRSSKRSSSRRLKRSSKRSSKRSLRKSRCNLLLKNKIGINMKEYKKGIYKSRAQAIAVSYSQIKKKHRSCRKILGRK